ncbi:hypothetical protein A9973_27265 [Achromobacter sp. UMC46]|nr:hypothetical protein [Achromobacter sp. UMC46]
MAQRLCAVRLPALTKVLATAMASALIAGCGGDEGPDTDAEAAAQGDGSAAGQVPIVAPPASGSCGDTGLPATQLPALNSKLDCAP